MVSGAYGSDKRQGFLQLLCRHTALAPAYEHYASLEFVTKLVLSAKALRAFGIAVGGQRNTSIKLWFYGVVLLTEPVRYSDHFE